MLRLNLRTLLAYLDDALEPALAKQVGQRIAESDQAQELIERIKQVTRRRRLTTPPEGAQIDPNTIAEFLDGTLSPEQQAELEEICLASDVHLAEVAACHQILASAKGEPALAPPTAKQRMVRLIHGPAPAEEATTNTKAPAVPAGDKATYADLVANAKRHKSLVVLVAGLVGGVLLTVALLQVLGPGRGRVNPDQVAKVKDDKSETPPTPKVEPAPPKKVETPEPMAQPKPDVPAPPVEKPAPAPEVKIEPAPPTTPKQAPVEPAFPPDDAPSNAVAKIAAYLPPAQGQTTILLQAGDMKDQWQRLDLTKPDVTSGRPLVSLPGCRSTVVLVGGVRVTLWGNLIEALPIPLHESVAVLHQHPKLDADLTLQRGRIVLTNVRDDRPAQVRLRFANPTNPETRQHMDITLMQKGAEVLVDRFSRFAPNEIFYVDPKHANRAGPVADMGVIVTNGDLELKFNDITYGMQAPPGRAMLMWNSQAGLGGATALDKLPDFVLTSPPPIKGVDTKSLNEMLRARDELSTSLSSRPAEAGLVEARASTDAYRRRLAVRCFGAIDDLGNLVDALEDKYPDVRAEAINTARHWIAADRDNDYIFFAALQKRYTATEAEKAMELLHNITDRQRAMPETYDFLIESLDNPRLLFRELARWQLVATVPEGLSIPYSADDAATRRKAQAAWRQLIPPGQLPKQQQQK